MMTDDLLNRLQVAVNTPSESALVSTDLLADAAAEITELRRGIARRRTEIDRLRNLILEWADVVDRPCDASDLALAMLDADEAANALRKAVGR